MPSYLNVFVAGELDLIESRSGPTQIRVITTKGKAELGRYALEATAQILQYYNDYFGVPYPLPKLDQIAIPGFFFSGRRRHTRLTCDWSSDVCSSDLSRG